MEKHFVWYKVSIRLKAYRRILETVSKIEIRTLKLAKLVLGIYKSLLVLMKKNRWGLEEPYIIYEIDMCDFISFLFRDKLKILHFQVNLNPPMPVTLFSSYWIITPAIHILI